MKTQLLIVPFIVLLFAGVSSGQQPFPPAKVDFEGFQQMTAEAKVYRQQRLVDFESFQKMAAQGDTLILDTRSEKAFQRKHLKGAVHLNFSDFTTEKLAQVIPRKQTRVLIYCNNNIDGDQQSFPTKRVALALNIPTFVNLYGYGYRNIYEMKDLIPADHASIVFEGTSVPPQVVGRK